MKRLLSICKMGIVSFYTEDEEGFDGLYLNDRNVLEGCGGNMECDGRGYYRLRLLFDNDGLFIIRYILI